MPLILEVDYQAKPASTAPWPQTAPRHRSAPCSRAFYERFNLAPAAVTPRAETVILRHHTFDAD